MQTKLFALCFVLSISNAFTSNEISTTAKNLAQATAATTAATSSASTTATAATKSIVTVEATKDKRQTAAKDTAVYPNHRSDTNVDDPEDPQETIYGPKPTQFLIRPIQAGQGPAQGPQAQLRNYPVTIRPHGTQLLEQSQEIQHFAYLQDISRNQPKGSGKSHLQQPKKLHTSATPSAQTQYSNDEEAEQRYAVAVQPQTQPRAYQPNRQQPYHLQPQQQQQQQQQQQPYDVIPEEQFLKLLEEELQARAYYEARLKQQQQQQQQQQEQQQQSDNAAAAASKASQQPEGAEQHQGLGNYRHRVGQEPLPPPTGGPPPEYVQYVPRQRNGPRFLPFPQAHISQQPQKQHQQLAEQLPEPAPELPPQIAYYQPQLRQPSSYKTLPNHPLAKSSLEKEIEKLLAANKPSAAAVQIVDNAHDPTQQQQPQPQHQPAFLPQVRLARPKVDAFAGSSTPNSLLDANNQPFIPSLFQFSGFQPPTPVYPTQVPQHVIDSKKLGPVVYPTQQPPATAQPSQYVYQEAPPSPPIPKPKAYRKQYATKLPPPASIKPNREKDLKFPDANIKFAQPQPQSYDFNPRQQHTTPVQFFPSPLDPITASKGTQPPPSPNAGDFQQYNLPGPSPSQSSIFVSQGTGILTPSRPTTLGKPKTLEDVKQLRLPQPGGKPLTQAEFQALVDAGYPVTAVPVPVPVPYEQYVKSHPEFRNQPLDFAQLRPYAQQPHPQQQLQQQYPPQLIPRPLASPSEPSVKIISSPAPPQTASALGGGSVTYLRAINNDPKRRPRDQKDDTKVAGEKEEGTE